MGSMLAWRGVSQFPKLNQKLLSLAPAKLGQVGFAHLDDMNSLIFWLLEVEEDEDG